ncbi:triacylglycerol lipase [Capronia epimyces CBS 606.96]|uniref:Carboxylic ester hydrolase n=1 Tax=Capronia epimyces CBS 606.96 TaxID=1182542 RepID=W9XYZ7_9EURO|nr:triacylglycerol lipase [Capronia epimyces CBS 606.96]EXJ82600.1 triacylglycerol lipase [Capronia epimyces CBS 606.96]
MGPVIQENKEGQQNQARPWVKLRQGTVVGITLYQPDENETHGSEKPVPVQAFLGIPYALPPTGDRRFRPPVKIGDSSDLSIDASRYGPAAPGKPLLRAGPKLEYSEDCLTVNVFRQQQVPQPQPHSQGGEDLGSGLLPVAIYVHGGAFNRGSASMHDTASLVAWSEQPFVAVSFNYRVGALGFLPSSLSAKEGALNLGLKDQKLLFEWVQENIGSFGGDKNNVTLFGLSAGAHSIGHHMMRHNDQNPGPFHRVIMESGAPTSRAVRAFDSELHERQFHEFLTEVGCPSDLPSAQVFPFLRSLSLSVITKAQETVFDRYNPSLRWAFQPVIDGEMILRKPIDSWRSGNYYKVPIMTGFCGNEGSLYVDKQMSTDEQFVDFFRTLLPQLSDADIDTVAHTLYPDPETSKDLTYKETRQSTEIGPQYKRVEAAYGHYAYVAPARQTAELASKTESHPPTFLYHWALPSTVIGGATHGDNMRYETYSAGVRSLSQNQKEISGMLHAYVTSFICNHGNPNAITGRWANRPKWEPYQAEEQSKSKPKTMIFGKGIEELIGGPNTGKLVELVYDDWAVEQSRFWWDRVEVTQQ